MPIVKCGGRCGETQFRLSSVSKPYTTLAALRLIEQGKLSLDDAVSEWMPWFTPALADGRRPAIKIRHLLSHTAGLDYRLNQPPTGVYHQLGIQDGVELSTLTLEQNLRLLAQAPLLSAPGNASIILWRSTCLARCWNG